jgi:hypothetical protein
MLSKADKILDRLAATTAAAGLPKRSDMYVADVQAIDNAKCKVLVGYKADNADAPTLAQLEDFFDHTFGNKIVAQTSSAQVHADNSSISVVATLNVPTRAYADINDLIRVSSNTFMDEKTQNLWQVVDTGTMKYLSRQSKEDIAEIVQARKAKNVVRAASFDKIKTAAPMALAGDQVKFMSAQNVILMGEVTSISDVKAVIKANGASHSVDRHAILQIVERSGSNLKSQKMNLNDYFTKAFGDAGFAKELTKETTQEDGLGTTVPTSFDKPKKR